MKVVGGGGVVDSGEMCMENLEKPQGRTEGPTAKNI